MHNRIMNSCVFILLCLLLFPTSSWSLNTIELHKSGTGKGTITSTPAGINCGGFCVLDYLSVKIGTPVTLTVVPDVGSEVTKWNIAGCIGNTCQFIPTGITSVTVTINTIPITPGPTPTPVPTPTPSPTSMSVTPTALNFTAIMGTVSDKQFLVISDTPLWSATKTQPWVKLSLVKLNTLGVLIDSTNLPVGTYTDTITIKSPRFPSQMVLVTVQITSNKRTFTWNPNLDGITEGYRLYKSTVAGRYTDPPIGQIIHPTTTFTLDIMHYSKGTYFFIVTAFNANGESLPSNEVSTTIP